MTAFPILQFGASRFLQAHVDLFVGEALPRGEAMGRIAVAGTTGSPESRRRVAAFATGKPYRVEVKGLAGGAIVDESVEVKSVGAGVDAATQWDELERLFIAARCAVSNTADRGYETDPADRLDAGPPRSFPAKLAKLLLARFSASVEPITLFPCELTPANGKVLRGVVLDVLDRWQAPANARRWVEEECVWVNSLVDRIVSEPFEPLGAVAEPYALWAIEDQPGLELPCRHAAIVVAGDLKPYERLKLFILNLGHTYLAEIWAQGQAARWGSRSARRWRTRRPTPSWMGCTTKKCCRCSRRSGWAMRREPTSPPSLSDSPIPFSITACPKSSPTTRPRSGGGSAVSSTSPRRTMREFASRA